MSNLNQKFYSLEEETTLQLDGKITLKDMLEKYVKSKKIPVNDFGQTIFFIYNGIKLDTNSKEKIVKIFKNNDTIFVINQKEKVTMDKILNNRKNKAPINEINDKKEDIKDDKKNDKKMIKRMRKEV